MDFNFTLHHAAGNSYDLSVIAIPNSPGEESWNCRFSIRPDLDSTLSTSWSVTAYSALGFRIIEKALNGRPNHFRDRQAAQVILEIACKSWYEDTRPNEPIASDKLTEATELFEGFEKVTPG